MAFTGNWTCDVFKTGMLSGVYNFNTGTAQTFNIALFTNAATLNELTSAYTAGMVGEVSSSGYTAGGQALTITQVPTTGSTAQVNANNPAYISFANVTWNGSFTARGALIYLANGTTNPTVCVLDFGSDKTSNSVFTIQFPAVTKTSAIITIT